MNHRWHTPDMMTIVTTTNWALDSINFYRLLIPAWIWIFKMEKRTMTSVTFPHRMMTHLSFRYDFNEKRKQYSIDRTMEMETGWVYKRFGCRDESQSFSKFRGYCILAKSLPKTTHFGQSTHFKSYILSDFVSIQLFFFTVEWSVNFGVNGVNDIRQYWQI